MKKNLTEIVFILDRSGSMTNLVDDTIGGFNSLLEKHQKIEGDAYLSTVLFDDRQEVLHNRVDIQKVKPITKDEYYARGCTALLDAIGKSIDYIGRAHKYSRESDVPNKTIFIITTDGLENASAIYSYKKIKSMIERQKEMYGWEFIFIGANIDAVAEARKFGIDESRAASRFADKRGTKAEYESIDKAIRQVRANMNLSASWKDEVEKDFNDDNRD